MRKNARSGSILAVLAVLAVVAAERFLVRSPSGREAVAGGERAILDAFAARRSNVPVEAEGTISTVLPDDAEGARHQRLIVALSGGHTVLVAHNIDLSPRVPARKGDRIGFRGEYEYNDKGGVVHWTHRDPAGRRPGGFIRHSGRTYE